jgi:hypothetical protein
MITSHGVLGHQAGHDPVDELVDDRLDGRSVTGGAAAALGVGPLEGQEELVARLREAARVDGPFPAPPASFVGVGTILFNMVTNPVTGKVYVSNTEARNEVRFEGPGRPAEDTRAAVLRGAERRGRRRADPDSRSRRVAVESGEG